MKLSEPCCLAVQAENIPPELGARQQWVLWTWEGREDGKVTKVPYQASGARARSNDPVTWTSFKSALEAWRGGRFDGVGFVLSRDDPFVAWDLDHCRDPDTGKLTDWALKIVQRLASYTEVTPSGWGLRVICRAALPPGGRKKRNIEVYDAARFITVSGHHLEGTPGGVEDRGEEVRQLHEEVFSTGRQPDAPHNGAFSKDLDDAELIRRARAAANGEKFRRLWQGDTSGYGSPSEADLALCGLLAYWTGGDSARMDRLFRSSGLYRPK